MHEVTEARNGPMLGYGIMLLMLPLHYAGLLFFYIRTRKPLSSLFLK